MRNIFLSLVFSLVVGFSSCSTLQKATPLSFLTQNTWVLQSLSGFDVSGFGESLPFLNFQQGGGLSGFAGCNNFTGNYSLEGMALKLLPGGMTRMACPDPVGAGEQSFIQGLEGVTSMKMDGSSLDLMGAAGEIMQFVPKR